MNNLIFTRIIDIQPITRPTLHKKRMAKTKVDLTDFKKLCKAIVITTIAANKKINPRELSPIVQVEIEFLVRTYRTSPDTPNFRYKGKKDKDRFVLARPYKLARVQNAIDKVTELYSRISEIAPDDRKTTVNVSSVNEESIEWAESVFKSYDINVDKDVIITAEEVQTRTHTKRVPPEDKDRYIQRFKDKIVKDSDKKTRSKVTIENLRVEEI